LAPFVSFVYFAVPSCRLLPVILFKERRRKGNIMKIHRFWLLAAGAALVLGAGWALGGPLHAVQPDDRMAGAWVTEMDSLKDYMTSVLEPINGECTSIEGPIRYEFAPGASHTLTISAFRTVVAITKRKLSGGADKIVITYTGGFQAPYSVSASELILDIGTRPDFSIFTVDSININGMELPGGEMNLTDVRAPGVAASMRFEFLDDNRLQLTPIFPPAPDGVNIHPRPFILRRMNPLP